MRKNKGIKLTLIILIIILLAMISFVGIYVQDKNEMKNILPEYMLGKDLKGYRKVALRVNDEVERTVRYDAEGKEIADTDTQTQVATTQEIKVNKEEELTKENYEKTKQIIQKRLDTMQVKDYIIRQDATDGTILLELPEDSNTDRIVGQLYLQGKFEMIDNDTNEVLMTNDDIASVKAGYGTNSNGSTVVFINLRFNKEGTEKFRDITNTYIETTVTKENEEDGESKEETVTKQIAIKIDESTLLTTHFEEEVSDGLLQLSVGSSTNSTTSQLQEYLLEANSTAAVLDAGKMPIVYNVEQNKFVYPMITEHEIQIGVAILIGAMIIATVYTIIKYKTKGILGMIAVIGYIALFLIALRYFNVEISIAGIIAILFNSVLSYVIVIYILKQRQVLEVIKKYSILCLPTLIIAIVFTFMNITMGMILFWGIVINLLYHISVTNMMLKE